MSASGHTCITCRVLFAGAELQRGHYKTDWHRYNLKRKVAELPSVTAIDFKDRVLSQQAASREETKPQYCKCCRKHFSSENAYSSHLRSKKHKDSASRVDTKGSVIVAPQPLVSTAGDNELVSPQPLVSTAEGSELVSPQPLVSGETVDSESEPEPLELSECLFCPRESKDMEESLKHMSMYHGFFIPDIKYLVDVKGFVTYLCEKVGVGYMCIWCNTKGKAFHCVEAVQQHMIDKCHCRLFFEDESALEYAEYYDYRSSYPDKDTQDAQDDDVIKRDASLKVSDELQLVLPSGIKVGHRSLRNTYKQHLPTFEQRKAVLIGRLMTQYRALGWKDGTVEVTARARCEKWALRSKQSQETKLKVKANKFQPHLRPQVVF